MRAGAGDSLETWGGRDPQGGRKISEAARRGHKKEIKQKDRAPVGGGGWRETHLIKRRRLPPTTFDWCVRFSHFLKIRRIDDFFFIIIIFSYSFFRFGRSAEGGGGEVRPARRKIIHLPACRFNLYRGEKGLFFSFFFFFRHRPKERAQSTSVFLFIFVFRIFSWTFFRRSLLIFNLTWPCSEKFAHCFRFSCPT